MCIGPSMLPTLHQAGDIVLVEHITPLLGGIQVGDVVVAQSPTKVGQIVCKRVAGLPGDRVKCKLHSYSKAKILTVPPGRVWLEGDNAKNSTDSRHYGPVPAALVTGRVFMRLWPLTSIGRLGDKPPPATALPPKIKRAR